MKKTIVSIVIALALLTSTATVMAADTAATNTCAGTAQEAVHYSFSLQSFKDLWDKICGELMLRFNIGSSSCPAAEPPAAAETEIPQQEAPQTSAEPAQPEMTAPSMPETTAPACNSASQTPTDAEETAPAQTPVKTPEKTPEKTPVPVPSTSVPAASSYAQQVVDLVNAQRATQGLSALTMDAKLAEVAQAKAQDMHDNRYFSHTSPTYGSPFDMMRAFGVSYRTAGENIAMGYPSAQAVMNGWMNSSGHRANILNSAYTRIGVGYVADGNYWVQEFTG